jgi:hypothetical protein
VLPLGQVRDVLEDVAAEEFQELCLQLVLGGVDGAAADVGLFGDLIQLPAFGQDVEDGLAPVIEAGREALPVAVTGGLGRGVFLLVAEHFGQQQGFLAALLDIHSTLKIREPGATVELALARSNFRRIQRWEHPSNRHTNNHNATELNIRTGELANSTSKHLQ